MRIWPYLIPAPVASLVLISALLWAASPALSDALYEVEYDKCVKELTEYCATPEGASDPDTQEACADPVLIDLTCNDLAWQVVRGEIE